LSGKEKTAFQHRCLRWSNFDLEATLTGEEAEHRESSCPRPGLRRKRRIGRLGVVTKNPFFCQGQSSSRSSRRCWIARVWPCLKISIDGPRRIRQERR